MESAFGIDHGVIFKAKKDKYNGNEAPSAGRRVAASSFGGYHAIAAGKKGKRGRAYGNVATRGIGGAGAGAAIGSAIGHVATRGKPQTKMFGPVGATIGGMAGGMAGGQAGIQRGVTINSRKGYYKKEE